MGHDPDSGDSNPYAAETKKNTTDATWLADTMPVDVNLDGLREYAKHMSDANKDLGSRQGHLQHLMSMPQAAWDGATLGEAAYTRSQMMANAGEFTAYLAVLGQTLMNIGSAAQTVADIYNTADGMSAASLNDVLFAFGDSGSTRPDGLPKEIGQTYDQAVATANAQTATPPDSALWGKPTEHVISQYQTVQVSYGPGGQRREVTTTNPPGGGTILTSIVYSADGKVLSTTSTRSSYNFNYANNTATKTVESYSGETLTGKAVTNTTYGSSGEVTNETTTNTDGKGQATGTRSESIDPETGEQVEVTTKVDDKNQSHETDRVTIGEATPGEQGVQDPIDKPYYPVSKPGS